MIYVKNISNKVIGIPAAEGGDAALLPDATMAVDDAYAMQVETLIGFGLIAKCAATEAVEAETGAEDAAGAANDNAAVAPAAEKKTRGRAKKDAE